ncbi:hypothetical protein dqs_2754 [Azoarcus olearius]|uniref:hypothetical protein n=1 Tax=Azoarcus sp. (strain BH72) TaxID=418699 RepID=UPI000806393C|nr:hypothetical protein [Azoarcus olearius]ANQ85783.1 hypothetical protein dqs_2754 [Azoarcus olearius]
MRARAVWMIATALATGAAGAAPGLAPQPPAATAPPPAAAPATVVEAPGSNLPPAGRSAFDQLFTAPDGQVRVPFPIAALLQHIAGQLDTTQPGGGLAVVLIPLGRSLQRHAAGDVEAFHYPRVVAAVTGEPPPAAAPRHRYLRDRLYVAYHEKSAALEVISYNDAAGRFEFQLVRDYRPGGSARVGYANRTLCLACHHNAAPIFSRQSWDETSASPPIAARLAATGRDFYGLRWRHGVDVPDAFDAATARANQLSAAQQVWREGCADASAAREAACRAGLLRLALHYRLGGSRHIALDDERARDIAAQLRANWQRHWPAGLPIADPTLPNRQPFAGVTQALTPQRLADVPATFDPLALRAPLAHWQGHDAGDLRQAIHVLAQFFSSADIRLLDRHLGTYPASTRVQLLQCEPPPPGRPALACSAPDGSTLTGRLNASDPARGGYIDRLVIDGANLGAFELGAARTPAPARFHPRRDGLALRNNGGEALRELRFGDGGRAVALVWAADLAPLDGALEALSQRPSVGDEGPLGDAPLRRDAVLAALLPQLGLPVAAAAPSPRAPAQLADPPLVRSTPWPPDLQPYARNCGQCHAEDSLFPPGFLRGDDVSVRASLARCAERIAYRLAMNRQPAATRPKQPMPPPAAAHAAAFARSEELTAMLETIAALLPPGDATHPPLLARPYATLAPCLPATPALHAATPPSAGGTP